MSGIVALSAEERRAELAAKVKTAPKAVLPKLDAWNYEACEFHDSPRPDCEHRLCGGDFFDHQTTGIAWLYLRKKALVADAPGAGKTNLLTGLLCLLKQRGELHRRAVIVVNTPAVTQWFNEVSRFAPGLAAQYVPPGSTRKNRIDRYSSPWDVLIVGAHMALKDRDLLMTLSPGVVISDDVDALLNTKAQTHKVIVDLADGADYVVVTNASSIQTNLSQLWASMAPLGGRYIWGSLPAFERRYLRKEWEEVRARGGGGKKVRVGKVVGVQNGEELRSRLEPWYIRRTYEDLHDVRMPELMPPQNVWLDLHPKQRAKYNELRNGVLEVQKKNSKEVRHVAALQMFGYGQQICAGLAGLGEADGPGKSVKLDWFMGRVQDAWAQERVVVYIRNVGNVKAAQARLQAAGVGFATVWGQEQTGPERNEEIRRFWEEPNCRVMIVTSAGERSINLQCSRILVLLDMPALNPERVRQLMGRVRRAGSVHSSIYTFILKATDTQEATYEQVLQKREAVNAFVWSDEETIFEKLSAQDLLRLIRP